MDANEGRFKLRDLLSVPMQRVLKYHLFLKVCCYVFLSSKVTDILYCDFGGAENAGNDNAGPDDDGPNCRSVKCKT